MMIRLLVLLILGWLVVDKYLDQRLINLLDKENFKLKIKLTQKEYEIESLKIRQSR